MRYLFQRTGYPVGTVYPDALDALVDFTKVMIALRFITLARGIILNGNSGIRIV